MSPTISVVTEKSTVTMHKSDNDLEMYSGPEVTLILMDGEGTVFA